MINKRIVTLYFRRRLICELNFRSIQGSTMKTKSVMMSLAVAASLCVPAFHANASVEDALANICNIVKANDKGELRKKMKTVQSDFNLRLGDYYDGVSCDGNSLIRTAILSDALDTGELLVKKLPKSKLVEPEKDGVELIAWIDSKGLSASPIAGIVKERM